MQNGEVLETSGAVKVSARSLDRKVTMVFSGQGAQWAGMGRELILSDKRFREDIEVMDSILQSLNDPPTWSILGLSHRLSVNIEER